VQYTVSGYIGLLCTLLGVVAFIWTAWRLAPDAFASYPALVWLVRLGAILAVLLFLYPMRNHLMAWFGGQQMPWLSALGMLGGGFGMSMVVAFPWPRSWRFGFGTSQTSCARGGSSPSASLLFQPSGTCWSSGRAPARYQREYAFKEIPPE
jgi:hypothetical protein